jgi:hypothetical protein
MHERRKEKRVLFYSHIEIIDQESGQVIGKLLDASAKGLRMQGSQQIDLFDHVSMQLRMPEKILGRNTISMIAECIWSRPAPDDSQYRQSGFEIYEISQQDSSMLIGLLLEAEKKD